MSIRQGDKIIAGKAAYTPSLLDFKWTDHILDDLNWIRADNFIWNSGLIYQAAYNHFLVDLIGLSAQTETIKNITITYYKANDGHKICLADQENNLTQLLEKTGIAWYYLIDTENSRFKLPRTKYGFTGLKSQVGKYVPQDVKLPNITGSVSAARQKYDAFPDVKTGVFIDSIINGQTAGFSSDRNNTGEVLINFDASKASSVYSGDGTDTLIQTPSTEMYLYFFVGNFTQTALENTAGINLETFNTKQDISTAVNYNNITNCLLEIPQDIKIEKQQDGSYSVKAGTIYYVPNGFEEDGTTKKFNKVILENDVNFPSDTQNRTVLCCLDATFVRHRSIIERCFSGLTAPSDPQHHDMWYDTSNNIIKRYNTNTQTWDPYGGISLPICKATFDENSNQKINQIFNGFGFIGNACYVLPGVKGLAPNGFNEDGSYKNILITVSKVYVNVGYNESTLSSDRINNDYLFIESKYLDCIWEEDYDINLYPTVASTEWALVYDTKKNQHYISDYGDEYTPRSIFNSHVKVYRDILTGKITSMSREGNIFKALDYNDTEFIAHQSMPSGKYIDLPGSDNTTSSLPANGSEYYAPANGFFYLKINNTQSGTATSVAMDSYSLCAIGKSTNNPSGSEICTCWLPVYKGEKIIISNNTINATRVYFRFIYAIGDR